MDVLIIAAVVFILLAVACGLFVLFVGQPGAEEASPYKRRRFLMDSNAEFGLFKVLVELYGEKYYVFPQVHYSHLLEVSKHDWKESRRKMNKLERKSADFVLCSKPDVAPQLVIELDGPTHSRARVRERDDFISSALKGAGLPVLHIPVGPYTHESIKKAVDEALMGK